MATKLLSAFSKKRLIELKSIYQDGLLHDNLPFWFPRAVDPEFGGYFTCFDRDGSRLQDDKSVWFQGRMAWTLATAWLEVEQRPEWLEWARSGIDFIEQHCVDTDGRMFFSVTRDGRPLRKRRYQFSECFAIITFSAYARATEQSRYQDRARELLADVIHRHRTPNLLSPKVDPMTRPMKGLAMPMILISTAQQLRKHFADPTYTQIINECITEIREDFLKPEFQCVLETVADDGSFIDTLDGRCVNPGHSIEAGWFILEEARQRGGDPELIKLGCLLIDWSLEIGWDDEHGGLFYFRDAKGLPCTEYWHDMKFWWPHNEAIIATLLAAELTGDARYADWHTRIHEWAYDHFPDKQHGEWFGYLHRDGSLSTPVKGTPYKGAFHVPRMMLLGWQSVQRQLDRVELGVV